MDGRRRRISGRTGAKHAHAPVPQPSYRGSGRRARPGSGNPPRSSPLARGRRGAEPRHGALAVDGARHPQRRLRERSFRVPGQGARRAHGRPGRRVGLFAGRASLAPPAGAAGAPGLAGIREPAAGLCRAAGRGTDRPPRAVAGDAPRRPLRPLPDVAPGDGDRLGIRGTRRRWSDGPGRLAVALVAGARGVGARSGPRSPRPPGADAGRHRALASPVFFRDGVLAAALPRRARRRGRPARSAPFRSGAVLAVRPRPGGSRAALARARPLGERRGPSRGGAPAGGRPGASGDGVSDAPRGARVRFRRARTRTRARARADGR
jgi:hypothetical protein